MAGGGWLGQGVWSCELLPVADPGSPKSEFHVVGVLPPLSEVMSVNCVAWPWQVFCQVKAASGDEEIVTVCWYRLSHPCCVTTDSVAVCMPAFAYMCWSVGDCAVSVVSWPSPNCQYQLLIVPPLVQSVKITACPLHPGADTLNHA